MNENINLIDILKDAPKGTKLYSSICGECWLDSIYNNIIRCTIGESYSIYNNTIRCTIGESYGTIKFDSKGRYRDFKGECLLFPSKNNRDWSTFTAPWKTKHFEPFQKVLIPGIMDNVYYWSANFYSHYDKKHRVHYLIDGETINDDDYIISYEGNEDKLGKPVK